MSLAFLFLDECLPFLEIVLDRLIFDLGEIF